MVLLCGGKSMNISIEVERRLNLIQFYIEHEPPILSPGEILEEAQDCLNAIRKSEEESLLKLSRQLKTFLDKNPETPISLK